MRLLRKHPLTLAANLRFAAPRAPRSSGLSPPAGGGEARAFSFSRTAMPSGGEEKGPYSAAVASGASWLRKRASNVASSSRTASRFLAFTGP